MFTDTLVMLQFDSVLRDERIFPEALKFDPNRFLEADDERQLNKRMINQLLVFGIGKRVCVGELLVRAELYLCFVTLIRKYRISLLTKPFDLVKHYSYQFSNKHYLKFETIR